MTPYTIMKTWQKTLVKEGEIFSNSLVILELSWILRSFNLLRTKFTSTVST